MVLKSETANRRRKPDPDRGSGATWLLGMILAGCAGSNPAVIKTTGSALAPVTGDSALIGGIKGVRVSFRDSDYFSQTSINPDTGCAGDAKIYYNPYETTAGVPTAFPVSMTNPNITARPSFLKNVSVDLTTSNSSSSSNHAYGCSLGTGPTVPRLSRCATFDNGAWISAELGTHFYSMFDYDCDYAGPINIADPQVNKLLAGGVYFDLDRVQMGGNENLLLNLTYIPMGAKNVRGGDTPLLPFESAVFRVHLVRTGMTLGDLWMVTQPRYLTYADTYRFHEIAKTFAIVAPPSGQVRQDQLVLPVSMDMAIDRIRIERYSGSGILVDASLYRLGEK